jgi:hypothetical protein
MQYIVSIIAWEVCRADIYVYIMMGMMKVVPALCCSASLWSKLNYNSDTN